MMTQENTLSRYRILHALGRGPTGAVYAARDGATGVAVALKIVEPALSNGSAGFAERFLKQARSARLLRHRNIVAIHDAADDAGALYVAMELLQGESLRKILDGGPLRVARAIQIVRDIASGLGHAHLAGTVHGGIKPSNIIILRSGVAKITDFGIGQLVPAAAAAGAPADHLSYLSPEQVRGEAIDYRCDIFSLGALFYEMLTRRPPSEGGSAKEIIEHILHADPPPPSELNPHVPRALDRIVLSMLARQPADRLPGAPILLRDLQRFEEELGVGSGASPGADAPATDAPPPIRTEPGPRTPEPRTPNRDREAFDHHEAMVMMERESRARPSPKARPGLASHALVLAVVGIGVAGFFMYSSSGTGERDVAASRVQEAPAPPAAPLPVAEAPKEPEPAAAALGAPPPAPSLMPAKAPPEQPSAAPAQDLARAPEPIAKDQEQPGGIARLIVAISPRGEIYIDGKPQGTTPPITTLDLQPGMHRIEVRSGSRKPYLTYITVEAGDVRRIRHDFNARPMRPPA